MQHLPVPEQYRHKLPEIPYLGVAPKYDRQGFSGFLERIGLSEKALLTELDRSQTKPDRNRILMANSIVQEWCWFGVLHEFEKSCGLEMPLSDMTTLARDGSRILNTSFLPKYIRQVVLKNLHDSDVPLSLQIGDRVYLRPTELDPAFMERLTNAYGDLNTTSFEILPTSKTLVYKLKVPAGTPLHNIDISCTELILAGSTNRTAAQTSGGENGQSPNPLTHLPISGLAKLLIRCDKEKAREWLLSARGQSESNSELARSVQFNEKIFILADSGNGLLINQLLLSHQVLCLSLANAADLVLLEDLNYKYQAVVKFPKTWCPSRTNRLFVMADALWPTIASALPSYDERLHVNCQNMACTFAPQSSTDIHPEHLETCDISSCSFYEIPETELINMLESGGNPCFTYDETSCELTMRDIGQHDFVAISHVWSHGLGNPLKNALPWCQIRRLFDWIRNDETPGIALWIDTLSVPIHPAYKKKAIAQLRNVYRSAKTVLVIDKHLQHVGSGRIERRLQIFGSEWMTRLWTLQEGQLSRSLSFRLAGGNVDLAEILDPEDDPSDEAAFLNSSGMATALRGRFSTPTDISARFQQLTGNVLGRRTTVPTDEPICLATLLGLELDDFGSSPTMADIYRSFPEDIPQEMAFAPGPRLTEPGLRWAPASWLHHRTETILRSTKGHLDARGFAVTRDGVFLASDFRLRAPIADMVYDLTTASQERFAFNIREVEGVTPRALSAAAIVIHSRLRQLALGLLVEMDRTEGDVHHCHLVARIDIALDVGYVVHQYWPSKTTVPVTGTFSAAQRFRID